MFNMTYSEQRAGCLKKYNSINAQCVQQIIVIVIIIVVVVSCHRPLLPGTSLEAAVIPTVQTSSFTLQYFPYYV